MTLDLTYSSEYLTQRSIEAMVESQRFVSEDAYKIISESVSRLIHRLVHHKKFPRGGVAVAARDLVERLAPYPSVVSAQIYQMGNTSRLSTREMAFIHTVFMTNCTSGGRRYLSFFGGQILLNRTNLHHSVHTVGLRVSPHAIHRYVRRGQKRIDEFRTGGLMAMIELSLPISMAAAQVGEPIVAVPFGGGLCLGRTYQHRYDPEKDFSGFSYNQTFGTRDLEAVLPADRDGDNNPMRPVVECLTFLDTEAMTGVRERIHAKLTALRHRHGAAVAAFYQHRTFGTLIAAHDPRCRESVTLAATAAAEAMYADCRRLLASPDWKEFSARAQAAEAERATAPEPVAAVP